MDPDSGGPANSSSRAPEPMSCPTCLKVFQTTSWWKKHLENPPNYCKMAAEKALRNKAPRPPPPSNTAILPGELHTRLAYLKSNLFVPDHIPPNVRLAVARELTATLTRVAEENSTDSWNSLLLFCFFVLGLPRQSGSADNPITAGIRANLKEKREPEAKIESTQIPKRLQPGTPAAIANAVNRKLKAGNISAAVRLLANDEKVTKLSPEVIQLLVDKHPANVPINSTPPRHQKQPFPEIKPEELADCIRSFPNATAGGPDGLQAGHLKQLISSREEQTSKSLLRAMCAVVTMMVKGKKDGGIRPIAVGSTWRRIAAKIISRRSLPLNQLFAPLQVGYATKNGCEAAVHAVRAFVDARQNSKQVHALVKIDVKNAFNCVDRNVVLNESAEHLPLYYPFIWQCYSKPTHLLCEDQVIPSRSGLQQGDPLGPLLYCLSTIKCHRTLQSELKVCYLDDDVLCGPYESVLSDFMELELSLRGAGLQVNPAKCELFLFGGTTSERNYVEKEFRSCFPSLQVVPADRLEYLGAPLLANATSYCFQKTSTKVLQLVEKTSILPAHQAYFLVKNCLGPVKLGHLLRAAKCFMFPEMLLQFDQSLRVSLSKITNCVIDELSWAQASLPVALGGIGIRSVRGLSVSAFLASAHSAHDLIQMIAPFDMGLYLGDAPELWKSLSKTDFPSDARSNIQKAWDNPLCTAVLDGIVLQLAHVPTSKARLLAVSTVESGAWLNCLPVSTLGHLLDDRAFQICIGLRLGLDVTTPHRCVCTEWADAKGHHALSCSKALGRHSRHANLNIITKKSLERIEVFSELEPVGLSLSDGRRPDGMTMGPWMDGKALVWDATCVCTLAIGNFVASSAKAGSAACRAEGRKSEKYAELRQNFYFVPLGFETFGSWGEEASKLLNVIGRKQIALTGEKRSMEFLRQRVSLAIQRGNAMCVVGTVPVSRGPVF